nr:MAG: major capsid protein [Microvirus sp.]
MANYTGLRELQNHVHRSGCDISQKNAFTAKSGELLPIFWDIALPNSTYRICPQYFTRTLPVETSAYTRVREYIDFYAVPIDLLWKSFDSSVIQMGEKAPVQSSGLTTPLKVKGDLPWCMLSDLGFAVAYQNGNVATGSSSTPNSGYSNFFGFNKSDLTHKLLTYLNYGNIVRPSSVAGSSTNRWFNFQAPLADGVLPNYSQKFSFNLGVSLLPLLAYQKIYQDFFRWAQWEAADPTSYNVDWYNGDGPVFGGSLNASIPSTSDYWKRDNMFSLRYCNWNKDMFMGFLPNSQFGDVSVINLSGADDSNFLPVEVYNNSSKKTAQAATAQSISTGTENISLQFPTAVSSSGFPQGSPLVARMSELKAGFSVLALRQAEALQKWKEITQSVDTDYRAQIKAHFGIDVPASDSHRALYIGGVAQNLDISEVINTQLDTTDSQAYIYGKGVGSGSGEFSFSTKGSYYVIMGIYHNVPLLDYEMSSPDSQLLSTNIEDLPIPEFDSIGMQPINLSQFVNQAYSTSVIDLNSANLGYLPRYYAWKTKVDLIHGAFTSVLRNWVAPITPDYYSKIFDNSVIQGGRSLKVTYPFFKVNPSVLDPIFSQNCDSTWATDQFLVNCNIECYKTHPLSSDGMPY